MHYVVAVGVLKRVRHFTGDLQGVVERKLLFAVEAVAEGLPGDVGHHVIEKPGGVA